MFTGIIETTGKIMHRDMFGEDMRIVVQSSEFDFSDVSVGDSIAVNGVCLTVVELNQDRFTVDVSKESLQRTSLATLALDGLVNLEKALRLKDRLGGHLVSGHVDGLGTIRAKQEQGRSTKFQIEVPVDLKKYVAVKGSICIDGVSLTVNEVNDNEFSVNIVPHTLTCTHFQELKVADQVNIEVDMIARYLERLLIADGKGINMDMLKRLGMSHE